MGHERRGARPFLRNAISTKKEKKKKRKINKSLLCDYLWKRIESSKRKRNMIKHILIKFSTLGLN